MNGFYRISIVYIQIPDGDFSPARQLKRNYRIVLGSADKSSNLIRGILTCMKLTFNRTEYTP